MNYSRLALAALGGTAASFAVGFLVLWLVPALFEEGYPAVFRPKEDDDSSGSRPRHHCFHAAHQLM